MAKGGFNKGDLEIGEKFEYQTIKYLNKTRAGCNFVKVGGYFPDYDLICKHCMVTVECKHDGKGKYSGNFFFETRCLAGTKAMYWIHKVDDNKIYMFKTDELKYMLRQHIRAGWLKEIKANNADNSRGYVVPIETMRAVCNSISYEQNGNNEISYF